MGCCGGRVVLVGLGPSARRLRTPVGYSLPFEPGAMAKTCAAPSTYLCAVGTAPGPAAGRRSAGCTPDSGASGNWDIDSLVFAVGAADVYFRCRPHGGAPSRAVGSGSSWPRRWWPVVPESPHDPLVVPPSTPKTDSCAPATALAAYSRPCGSGAVGRRTRLFFLRVPTPRRPERPAGTVPTPMAYSFRFGAVARPNSYGRGIAALVVHDVWWWDRTVDRLDKGGVAAADGVTACRGRRLDSPIAPRATPQRPSSPPGVRGRSYSSTTSTAFRWRHIPRRRKPPFAPFANPAWRVARSAHRALSVHVSVAGNRTPGRFSAWGVATSVSYPPTRQLEFGAAATDRSTPPPYLRP